MALEDIFRALEEQAESEVQEILKVAKAQAKAIKDEARDEAERIRKARIGAADDVVRMRAGKTLNAAKLQAKKNLAGVRDTAIEDVFSDAAGKLAKMRGTSQYEKVFRALVEEALVGVEGSCELLVASEDAKLAEKVAKDLGVQCAVSPTLDTIGGVAVAFDEGRILRRNTFEGRLAKVKGLAQAKVAEVLGS
jgi:vacuolar-type H+-ATPase subunit E/Vma4